jgi:hypothetical protein
MATIARLRPLQEWFARSAIISIALVLALPVIGHVIRLAIGTLSSFGSEIWPAFLDLGQIALFAVILTGQVAFVAFLVRRWRRRTSHGAASAADDIDRARSRRRERLMNEDEDLEP